MIKLLVNRPYYSVGQGLRLINMVGVGEAKLPRKFLLAVAAAALPPLPRQEKGFLAGLQPSNPPCRPVNAYVLSLTDLMQHQSLYLWIRSDLPPAGWKDHLFYRLRGEAARAIEKMSVYRAAAG